MLKAERYSRIKQGVFLKINNSNKGEENDKYI